MSTRLALSFETVDVDFLLTRYCVLGNEAFFYLRVF